MPCRRHTLALHCLFFLLVALHTGTKEVLASSTQPQSTDTSATVTFTKMKTKIVFSDVDGTLVHYPETIPENDDNIMALPPSSTGMRAIISQETLRKCRDIQKTGRKLVLVSGMRTSTLLNRLPYLPRADAYCSEAGGRIFYPTRVVDDDDDDNDNKDGIRIEPVSFDGATEEDLMPFGLQEDLEWRKTMQEAAGADGFVGQELSAMISSSTSATRIPVSQRQGLLWEYARLLESQGLTLDTKGYATSFRVTARQQKESAMDAFRALQQQRAFPCPPQVTTRTNLGSMDFFPTISGKKNVCEYLAMKLAGAKLAEGAVCMGDDDNDIEMALACRHAFIPTVTSETMAETIAQHSGQFTAVRGFQDTLATEMALQKLLEMLEREEETRTE